MSAFDIVGDVHGCFDELIDLLSVLGYQIDLEFELGNDALVSAAVSHPDGRIPILAGDLIDRGPRSAMVLDLVMTLTQKGQLLSVIGNHDNKLMRVLGGNSVKVGVELQMTLDQIFDYRRGFPETVLDFLRNLPLVLELDGLIVVHGAYKETPNQKTLKALALYGETDGSADAHGHPIRGSRWEDRYSGDKTIVHGHVRQLEPTIRQTGSGAWIVNVDTSCVFGNKLTAFSYPEMEFVSVPARAVYFTGQ